MLLKASQLIMMVTCKYKNSNFFLLYLHCMVHFYCSQFTLFNAAKCCIMTLARWPSLLNCFAHLRKCMHADCMDLSGHFYRVTQDKLSIGMVFNQKEGRINVSWRRPSNNDGPISTMMWTTANTSVPIDPF